MSLLQCFYETCCAYFIAIMCCIFTCGNSPLYTKLRRRAKRGPCPIIKPIDYKFTQQPQPQQEAVDLIADITHNIGKKHNIYRDNLYLIFIEIGNRFPMDIINIIMLFSQFSQRIITRQYTSKISDRIDQEMPLRIAVLGVDNYDTKSIADYLREHTLEKLNYDGIDFYFNRGVTTFNANIIQNVFDYHIVILVFDLSDITTLDWCNNGGIDLRQFNETAMILCGVHCDLKPVNDDQIDQRIKTIMDFYNCPYIEVSSEYNVNMDKLLDISVREYNEQYCQYLWRKDGQIWPDCIVL